MRILVVNDDGIQSPGIRRLAEMACKLGEVWVVAPASQCSAMSHRITVCADLEVRKVEFPVEGVYAYSVSGTPADCVKAALLHIMPQKPDVVFSGINNGYNAGHDILFSGTIGAAMEALLGGVPAIAFSSECECDYDVVDEYLYPIAKELIADELPLNQIWNVNFPCCPLAELKGILRDREPAQTQFYLDHYDRTDRADGSIILSAQGVPITECEEGTDIGAVLAGYISIGKVQNHVLSVR